MNKLSLSKEFLSGGTGVTGKIIGGALITAVISSVRPFRTIDNNHMGFRRYMGKVKRGPNDQPMPKILGPGLHWMMPFTHSIEIVSTQPQTTDLGRLVMDRGWVMVEKIENGEIKLVKQEAETKKQSEIHAEVEWRVNPLGNNPYRAVDEVDDREAAVKRICRGALGKAARSIDDIQGADPNLLTNVVGYHAYDRLLKIGVELLHVTGMSDNRTFGEMVQTREGFNGPLPPSVLFVGNEQEIPELHAVNE